MTYKALAFNQFWFVLDLMIRFGFLCSERFHDSLTVSLNDLKAAPSAMTPDCLIDTFVDDAEKSVEPDPPHRPHILEMKNATSVNNFKTYSPLATEA